MITRETLELAAKAAGYEIQFQGDFCAMKSSNPKYLWNPEHDDGDSARLRTDLGIEVVCHMGCVWCNHAVASVSGIYADHENKHAALRYATLMVAAEIGRRMP